MKKTDWYILIPILLGAIWLAFLPNKRYDYHEISPKDLLYQISLDERYVSTDEIAKFIISQDPSVILVDVRTPEEYAKFTLQGALNIPFDSLLNPNYAGYLDQDVYTVVLFSNGSSLADQAWFMLKRIDFEGTQVMKGGLNEWIETIIRPQKPEEDAETEQWELYETRKTASLFFGGGNTLISNGNDGSAPSSFVVPTRKKSDGNVGGCE
ncbi:MAG: rhodanese-like domain-containing protein [Bacteroidota bacterium]|nr:rhodanese-like domain-containing protein [Bacteroidota bacterium]